MAEGRSRDFCLDRSIVSGRKGLDQSFFRGLSAVVIDDGIAQDAVKPCREGVDFAQIRHMCDGPDIGSLEKVLGGRPVAYPSPNKAEETFALLEEAGDSSRGRHDFHWMLGGWEGISRRPDQK